MSHLTRVVVLSLLFLTSSTLFAQYTVYYASTDLTPQSGTGHGKMDVGWKWTSTVAGTTAEVEVFEYLGPLPGGKPKLGGSIYKKTNAPNNNPTPKPVATGTSGTQYVSRIQLSSGGSVYYENFSSAPFAP
jgi:hypothetical protein